MIILILSRGNDDESRLGPRRACASGWIAPRQMMRAVVATTLLACAAGLPLVVYGGLGDGLGWRAVRCVLLPLHYVIVIYGHGRCPCACVFRHCAGLRCVLSAGRHGFSEAFVASLACGFVIDTLLLVNNYRDIDGDLRAGKAYIGGTPRGASWTYGLSRFWHSGIPVRRVVRVFRPCRRFLIACGSTS